MEMVVSGEPVVPASTRVSFGGGPAPAPERGGWRRAWIPRAHMPRTHRLASAVDPAGPVRRPAAPPLVAVGPSAPCKMSARVLAFSLRLFPLSSPSCGGGVGCGNRPLPPSLEGAFVVVPHRWRPRRRCTGRPGRPQPPSYSSQYSGEYLSTLKHSHGWGAMIVLRLLLNHYRAALHGKRKHFSSLFPTVTSSCKFLISNLKKQVVGGV